LRLRVRRSARLDDLESRLVWILGGPRTGSTWLLNLLVHPHTARAVPINEPYLGVHLAPLVSARPGAVISAAEWRANDSSYFFDQRQAAVWRPHLRRLILERFAAQAGLAGPEHSGRDRLVVVKEPNGSEAAPILLSTLPRSRLLFLLRDPRDVLDSQLDAVSCGSWMAGDADPEGVATESGRIDYLSRHAALWLYRIEAVERATAAHAPELVMTVRYEELRSDAAAVMRSIASWLEVEVGDAGIADAVRANAFEELPPEVRGPGKALRLATPGAWRENLSPGEQAAIMEIVGDKLTELGYRA